MLSIPGYASPRWRGELERHTARESQSALIGYKADSRWGDRNMLELGDDLLGHGAVRRTRRFGFSRPELHIPAVTSDATPERGTDQRCSIRAASSMTPPTCTSTCQVHRTDDLGTRGQAGVATAGSC
jgi:hypothetical protein